MESRGTPIKDHPKLFGFRPLCRSTGTRVSWYGIADPDGYSPYGCVIPSGHKLPFMAHGYWQDVFAWTANSVDEDQPGLFTSGCMCARFNMKFYQYISMPKIEMLHQQVAAQDAEREAEVGFDIKLLKGSIKTKSTNELGHHQKLDAVVKKLNKLRLVGEIDEDKPYVRGVLPLRFGGYGWRMSQASPIAFWGGLDFPYPLKKYAFAMAGSRHNVLGEAKMDQPAAHSHSLTDAMVSWFVNNLPDVSVEGYEVEEVRGPFGRDEMTDYDIANGTWLAASQMSGVRGEYEFVARVLHRSDWEEGFRESSTKKLVLATPLYVAMVD